LNNVILTPHIGGSTQEAQANIALDVAHKLVQHVRGGTTVGAVNLPQAQLAMPLRTWRLCHFHLNRPGILDALNHLIASQGWNIAGQVLQTDHQLGVVLMDVEGTHLETLHAALQAIPGTLRVRMVPPGQRP
jgi:D-3-phosphoglycerate dehydrogenase